MKVKVCEKVITFFEVLFDVRIVALKNKKTLPSLSMVFIFSHAFFTSYKVI